MANRNQTALFVAMAVVVSASAAQAQRWGRGGFPRDGVCFYENPDFRGDYFCVRAGEDLRSVPSGMNDSISSMRVYGRAEVIVYKDRNFDGRSATFDGDVRDLRLDIWNDRISSIQVRSGRGIGRRDDDRRDDRRNDRRDDRRDDRRNDRRYVDSESAVRRAYRDILDREPDFSGMRLYRSRMEDDGWTEAQVREALRSSPEYRNKNAMTRERAEDIVNRAYRSVLGRDADSGSGGYVNRVMRDHWTQQDVERELRKSPEYRNRNR